MPWETFLTESLNASVFLPVSISAVFRPVAPPRSVDIAAL